jgi:hypothetical protein
MFKRFQLFYLVRDKSAEFSVRFNASSIEEAKAFFEIYFEGLELMRVMELTGA